MIHDPLCPGTINISLCDCAFIEEIRSSYVPELSEVLEESRKGER